MVAPMYFGWKGGRLAVAALLGLAWFPTTASAAFPQAEETAERIASLRERVALYWNYRAEPDWGKIYDQLVDPRVKVKVSKGNFTAQKASHIVILSHEILDIRLEGLEAQVTATYRYRMPVPLPGAKGRREVEGEDRVTYPWVFVEGQWYLKLRDPSILPD